MIFSACVYSCKGVLCRVSVDLHVSARDRLVAASSGGRELGSVVTGARVDTSGGLERRDVTARSVLGTSVEPARNAYSFCMRYIS